MLFDKVMRNACRTQRLIRIGRMLVLVSMTLTLLLVSGCRRAEPVEEVREVGLPAMEEQAPLVESPVEASAEQSAPDLEELSEESDASVAAKEAAPPEARETVQPAALDLKSYLVLPVWDFQKRAYDLLLGVSGQETLEALDAKYTQAAELLEQVASELDKLDLPAKGDSEINRMNGMQLQICRGYAATLREFTRSHDPAVLGRLSAYDQKTVEFLDLVRAGTTPRD